MRFKLTIDCGNAAFEDNAMLAVSKILQDLADTLYEDSPSDPLVWDHPLDDANGNVVGKAQFDADTADSEQDKETMKELVLTLAKAATASGISLEMGDAEAIEVLGNEAREAQRALLAALGITLQATPSGA